MSYGLIFFILVRFFIFLINESYKTPCEKENMGPAYRVNEKNIQISHIHHCKKLLGLAEKKVITDEDIKHAYNQVYNEVAELRISTPVFIDVAELRAAKCYLLDRWAYMAHPN